MVTVSTQRFTSHPLRAIRAARGLPLRTVASRANIDPGHLSKVERGQSQLSVHSLYRLAVVLDLHELSKLLKPYIPHRDVAIAPDAQSETTAGNDDDAGYQPAPPVERTTATTSKQ